MVRTSKTIEEVMGAYSHHPALLYATTYSTVSRWPCARRPCFWTLWAISVAFCLVLPFASYEFFGFSRPKSTRIYHCTSGGINPCKWGEMGKYVQTAVLKGNWMLNAVWLRLCDTLSVRANVNDPVSPDNASNLSLYDIVTLICNSAYDPYLSMTISVTKCHT